MISAIPASDHGFVWVSWETVHGQKADTEKIETRHEDFQSSRTPRAIAFHLQTPEEFIVISSPGHSILFPFPNTSFLIVLEK
jgi:hypothetical protein